jgi:sugar O-acyltransferase (sialic acid O-acetyltransferase NeuD family)
MRRKLIIFGLAETAEVLHYFFSQCEDYEPVAFTVDQDYLSSEEYLGLPVVAFNDLERLYNPSDYWMFVAVGYSGLNAVRADKITACREKGFKLASFIHPHSSIPSDLEHGENCFIMNDVHIHPKVIIGDNNFFWSGSILAHHSVVGSDCWFTSGAKIAGNTSIGDRCFFGINATVTNGIRIGDRCFLGAGTLVNYDLNDDDAVIAPGTSRYRLKSSELFRLKGSKI